MAVIGGDKRTAYMVPFLREKGYRIISYELCSMEDRIEADGYADSLKQALDSAEIIICGIPIEKKGIVNLRELSRHMRKRYMVFGGVIPESFRQECEERGISCYDFMKDEGIAIFNAVATAEGAILEALLHKETNIHGSRSLVLGYGRCGKVLAQKLKALSAEVTVCSENVSELALAEAMGLKSIPIRNLEEELFAFEYIYNTIPALILDAEKLKRMNRNALIIDIASGKGGINYKEAKKLKIKALHCLGLPGKYAGKISAQKLADYVIGRL